jgi:2-phosphosulfolactate phosphatase
VSAARIVVDLVPGADDSARAGGGPAAWTGVAIDVLRATSTLGVAREHGASRVVAFATTEEALRFRAANPGSLACGERGGRIVPGFDLGNSPAEYTAERVGGRTLAFASTNGSRAMRALAACGERWLGSYVCAGAVLARLDRAARLRIVCAGKEGAFALEDASCAGWFVARLVAGGAEPGNDAARLCAAIAPRDAGEVRALVEGCDHARALAALGPEYAADVRFCATLDAVNGAHGF